MKNYQMIVIVALILALGAFIFFKDKKKPCGCGKHDQDELDEPIEE